MNDEYRVVIRFDVRTPLDAGDIARVVREQAELLWPAPAKDLRVTVEPAGIAREIDAMTHVVWKRPRPEVGEPYDWAGRTIIPIAVVEAERLDEGLTLTVEQDDSADPDGWKVEYRFPRQTETRETFIPFA